MNKKKLKKKIDYTWLVIFLLMLIILSFVGYIYYKQNFNKFQLSPKGYRYNIVLGSSNEYGNEEIGDMLCYNYDDYNYPTFGGMMVCESTICYSNNKSKEVYEHTSITFIKSAGKKESTYDAHPTSRIKNNCIDYTFFIRLQEYGPSLFSINLGTKDQTEIKYVDSIDVISSQEAATRLYYKKTISLGLVSLFITVISVGLCNIKKLIYR